MSGPAGDREPLVCPLCGYACDPPGGGKETTMICSGCPLGPKCDLHTCPHCGYSLPGRSRLLSFLRRLWKGGDGPHA